jgi:uncharacterized protein YjdB
MSFPNLTSGPARLATAAADPAVSRFVAAAVLLAALGCKKTVTASGPPVAAIEITPTSLALSPGSASPLTANVLDGSGSRLAVPVHWASADTRVATVSSQGVVSGVAPGRTEVAASKGGKSAVVPVTVAALPPALVRVVPTTSTIDVGARDTLGADVLDAGGATMQAPTVTWSSANTTIATVTSNGIVTGVAAGSVVITATAAGLNGTAVVTVRQPTPASVATVAVAPSSGTVRVGRTLQLTATARDSAGRVVSGHAVIWTSDNLARAVVLPGGLVSGVSKGNVTVRATIAGKSGTAAIRVN